MLFFLLACGANQVGESADLSGRNDSKATSESGNPKVLLLVVDGVRVEEMSSNWASPLTGRTGEVNCPNFWSTMAAEGTMVRAIWNTGITLTAPAHVALFTGRPEPYDNLPINTATSSLYYPESPTIWQMAARAGIQSAFIGNADLLVSTAGSLYPPEWTEEKYQTVSSDSDKAVLDAVLEKISTESPQLVVANLHKSDDEGHQGAAGTYAESVQNLDRQIAEFWADLKKKEPEWVSQALVVVTTDHGRHRKDPTSEVDWKSHGDACAGCREIPLLLIGPGIQANQVIERDWTSADTSNLIAAWLGVDLPFAEGIPLDSITHASTPLRQGEVGVRAAGTHHVVRKWEEEAYQRAKIRVDDEEISSSIARDVGRPAIAAWGERLWVCWSELQDLGETVPWIPHCSMQENGVWSDIGFPLSDVPATWEVRMIANEEGLWVGESDGTIGLLHWDGKNWSSVMGSTGAAAMHPSVAAEGGHHAMSWVEGERNSRSARVWVDGRLQQLDFGGSFSVSRVERTAVQLEGSTVSVAALVYSLGTRFVMVAMSGDLGETWGAPSFLPASDPFLPNMPPRWVKGRLYWAALLESGTAGICSLGKGETAPICKDFGSKYMDSFAVDNDGPIASVRIRPGVWELKR